MMAEALSITAVLLILLRVTITMIPAMTANTFAPFLGGGTPVDFGLTRKDGRRYLGDGKTWRGFIGGSAGAALLGIIILVIMHFTGITDIDESLWGPLPLNIALIIALAVGSLFGDILGSFIKRALNRPRGTRTPFLDQWDYIIGAVIFILPFYPWWFDHLIADYNWIGSILFLAIAMIAHIVANRIGYMIGVKKEPW